MRLPSYISHVFVRRHVNISLPLRTCTVVKPKYLFAYDFSLDLGVSAVRQLHFGRCLFTIRVVNVPPFAESVTEGDIVWKKAIGDIVKEDDVIAEIETDKTNVPVPAPCAGVITQLLVEDGSKVTAGQDIFKMEEGVVSPPKPAEKPHQEPEKSEKKPVISSPTPTISHPPSTESVPCYTSPPSVPTSLDSTRAEQRVKMSRMRLRIAQRLKDAQTTCAMLSTFNEIDMSNLFELRHQYKDAFLKSHGVKLGMMSTFAKASAVALMDQPAVNAVIDGSDIIYRDYVDISIAVATPKGLVVPVLRNVEKMNYADIERGINDLGVKAREGKLAVEDMDGGTFTISNGGVFGSLFGTPIINPPQSAILGLYGVFDRPVARNGQVVIRPMMYVALTYDHRLIDGREAVTFLRKIKEFVEDPRTYFLQI
ncbi:Dihydrolipoyllysine-residue succinyltransferase component of 2-oxoglutarate dehydrogenase complex [Schistosoma japonicum]|uniref:Dihydrolipoyllysine-residue succinyltransferase component of 2-oxoglutarate dehydrogenase complex, mitochondrial n=2 Tax=Schistosoma japonicum TaxID=6182 RepID=A0A4Z2D8U0_SCHJA|nr:Dihydrolipoyllysine-residue succinyltransferase component of 2-oxoglutarate dehydrogenase complex [Schistosoma japonicum]TNN12581.1 Dihydrolipoyllysine-residue succinyltransferase component of 2-oxoglutarate dehydrogenase complex [Schistosoma japonicum]